MDEELNDNNEITDSKSTDSNFDYGQIQIYHDDSYFFDLFTKKVFPKTQIKLWKTKTGLIIQTLR